jgi:hypothetical protein
LGDRVSSSAGDCWFLVFFLSAYTSGRHSRTVYEEPWEKSTNTAVARGIMDCMNATEIEVAVWLLRPGKNLEKTLNRRNIAARIG